MSAGAKACMNCGFGEELQPLEVWRDADGEGWWRHQQCVRQSTSNAMRYWAITNEMGAFNDSGEWPTPDQWVAFVRSHRLRGVAS